MFILRKTIILVQRKKKIKATHSLCPSKLINEEAHANTTDRKARELIPKFEVYHRRKHAVFRIVHKKETKFHASETVI